MKEVNIQDSRIKPIIVLGRNRSGTKWLSNMLSNHSKVASVQHEVHCGIIESNLLNQQFKTQFGRLDYEVNKKAFLAVLTSTNFFKVLDEDENFVRGIGSNNYNEYFKILMERYARRQGASFWLQKAYSLHLEEFFGDIPDASYIIIQRSLMANIASTAFRYKRGKRLGKRSLFQSVLGYYAVQKYENRIAKRYNIPIVGYEELVRDTEAVLKAVCKASGLVYEPGMEVVKFRRNTTYKHRGLHQVYKWSVGDQVVITAGRCLGRLLPLGLLKGMRKIRQYLAPQEEKFIPGSFNDIESIALAVNSKI